MQSSPDAPARPAGLQVSVHGHPNSDTLLLWHPATADTDGREQVARLASRIGGRNGLRVVLPTIDAAAGGRDLLRSIRYARESSVHPPDRLSIVGYGPYGVAALSLALHQRRLGIGLVRVTCVDGAPGVLDPVSGQPLPQAPAPRPDGVDTAVDVVANEAAPGWAEDVIAAWTPAGWQAQVVPADQFTWRV